MQFKNVALLIGLLVAGFEPAVGAGLSADQIMEKADAIYGGDDSVETVNFVFHQPGESERKLTYTMAWKKYKGNDFVRKVIFFTEFPPDKRGEAYMAWFYPLKLHKEDDAWIYLPDLRSIRKIGHHHEAHNGNDREKDEFSKSVLKDEDLMPRAPNADKHNLLRTEQIDGKNYYVIENVPKHGAMPGMMGMEMDYPYGKTVEWVDSDNFLVTRIDYYDTSGDVVKTQRIEWKKLGKAWVWSKLHAVDNKTHNETVMEISDIRVNVGLGDRVFTKRAMRLGLASVVQ